MTRTAVGNNSQKGAGTRLGRLVRRTAEIETWLAETGKSAPSADLVRLWNERVRPFWRLFPGIYRTLSGHLLKRGDNFLAAEVAGEGSERFPDDAQLVYNRALSLARVGARDQAHDILAHRWEALAGLSDARPLLGRLYKDSWKTSGRRSDLVRSRDEYAAACEEERPDVYYPAVNAATLSALLDEEAAAARFSELVRNDLASHGGPSNYWEHASLAEACLAAGDLEAARTSYGAAAATQPSRDQLLTTREQAVMLLEKQSLPLDSLDDLLGRPLVICITGHVIDGPDRLEKRFPADRERSVRQRIDAFLAETRPWLGVGATAGGSDLLCFEALHQAGIETAAVLPLETGRFRETSVISSGSGWSERFEAAMRHASSVWISPQNEAPENGSLWHFANEIILGTAIERAREWRGDLLLLAVWDGRPGDGPGGTADMLRLARAKGVPVRRINPLDDLPARPLPEQEDVHSGRPNAPLRFCLHLSLRNRLHAAAVRAAPGVAEPLGAAIELIELEGEVRAIFESPERPLEILRALAGLRKRLRFGIGLAAGPQPDKPSSPAFLLSEAAQLAQISRAAGNILAAAEFVTVSRGETPTGFGFEYVGRRELTPGIETPVYSVSLSEEAAAASPGPSASFS